MGQFIQKYNFERNVRVILMMNDFITQLAKVQDSNNAPMIFNPMRASITKAGQGIGVEYPTARVSFLNPEPEFLAEGDPFNLHGTLAIDLIFNVSAQDEDGTDVDIQEQAYGFGNLVLNYVTPQRDDNPNGMIPVYPRVWEWQDKVHGKQNLSRNLTRILPNKDNGLTGSVYVVPLYLPIRVFLPTQPWPLP